MNGASVRRARILVLVLAVTGLVALPALPASAAVGIKTYYSTTYDSAHERLIFEPGETVYARATGLNTSRYYKWQVLDATGAVVRTASCVLSPGSGILTDSYATTAASAVSVDDVAWTYRITEYTNSGCS